MMIDKFNYELYNEFPHLSPIIELYNLNIEYIGEVVSILINTDMTFQRFKYSKSRVECSMKAYIISPNSKLSVVFAYDCELNGIDLDNLKAII